jgi:hypothetical protein
MSHKLTTSSFALAFLLSYFLTFSLLFAQQLGELEVADVPAGAGIAYIVRNADEAVLIVHSTVAPLSFESNMGIIRVDNPDPGEYRVHLLPGTCIITFKADNYLPLKERYFIDKKSYREVRVRATYEAVTGEERPEITLRYTPASPAEKVLGSLDDKVMNLNFKSGAVVLKPASGSHTVRLISSGRVWEKSYDLKPGERITEDVVFPETRSAVADTSAQPGNIYINSDPSGATVYMNQVQQGQTPLTMEDVPPGRYEMDVVKPLYLPQRLLVEVKSLEYSQQEVKLTPNFGSLRVQSDPPGAVVYLNDKERGATPVDLPQIDAGDYRLRLAIPRYNDAEDTFRMKSGDKLERSFTLKPKFGQMVITSEPAGASVYGDGQLWGVTPLTRDTVLSGTHVLLLRAEYYNPYDDLIKLTDGEAFNRHYQLVGNFGLLTVIADPPGAQVNVEGPENTQFTAPIEGVKLQPGSYMVKVEKEGYETFTTAVMMALGAEERLEPVLVQQTGHLKVSSTPQGAQIYLDDQPYGTTPTFLHDIPTGTYTIKLDKSGYDLLVDRVTLENRAVGDFSRMLSAEGTKTWRKQRQKAVLLSVVLPGGGQIGTRQYPRGVLYAGVFLASLIYANDARNVHSNRKYLYENARERYIHAVTTADLQRTNTEMQQAYDDMQSASDRWQMFVALTGGVYALQLADAYLWGGGRRPVVRLSSLDGSEIQPYIEVERASVRAGISIFMRAIR